MLTWVDLPHCACQLFASQGNHFQGWLSRNFHDEQSARCLVFPTLKWHGVWIMFPSFTAAPASHCVSPSWWDQFQPQTYAWKYFLSSKVLVFHYVPGQIPLLQQNLKELAHISLLPFERGCSTNHDSYKGKVWVMSSDSSSEREPLG